MIAVALLAAGILLWIWPPASSELMFLHGVLVKSGTTLLMLWLALPQLEKMPVWLIVPIGLVAVLVIAYPQVRPLLVAGWCSAAAVRSVAVTSAEESAELGNSRLAWVSSPTRSFEVATLVWHDAPRREFTSRSKVPQYTRVTRIEVVDLQAQRADCSPSRRCKPPVPYRIDSPRPEGPTPNPWLHFVGPPGLNRMYSNESGG